LHSSRDADALRVAVRAAGRPTCKPRPATTTVPQHMHLMLIRLCALSLSHGVSRQHRVVVADSRDWLTCNVTPSPTVPTEHATLQQRKSIGKATRRPRCHGNQDATPVAVACAPVGSRRTRSHSCPGVDCRELLGRPSGSSPKCCIVQPQSDPAQQPIHCALELRRGLREPVGGRGLQRMGRLWRVTYVSATSQRSAAYSSILLYQ